jgi:hypothetical protein
VRRDRNYASCSASLYIADCKLVMRGETEKGIRRAQKKR